MLVTDGFCVLQRFLQERLTLMAFDIKPRRLAARPTPLLSRTDRAHHKHGLGLYTQTSEGKQSHSRLVEQLSLSERV